MIHPETIKLITYTAYLNNMKLQKSTLTNEGEEVVYKPTSVELLKIGIDVNNISLEETLAKAFKKWIEKITGQKVFIEDRKASWHFTRREVQQELLNVYL